MRNQKKKKNIKNYKEIFLLLFMPIFIYWRYKDGKYKKYIINDKTLLGEMKKEE